MSTSSVHLVKFAFIIRVGQLKFWKEVRHPCRHYLIRAHITLQFINGAVSPSLWFFFSPVESLSWSTRLNFSLYPYLYRSPDRTWTDYVTWLEGDNVFVTILRSFTKPFLEMPEHAIIMPDVDKTQSDNTCFEYDHNSNCQSSWTCYTSFHHRRARNPAKIYYERRSWLP